MTAKRLRSSLYGAAAAVLALLLSSIPAAADVIYTGSGVAPAVTQENATGTGTVVTYPGGYTAGMNYDETTGALTLSLTDSASDWPTEGGGENTDPFGNPVVQFESCGDFQDASNPLGDLYAQFAVGVVPSSGMSGVYDTGVDGPASPTDISIGQPGPVSYEATSVSFDGSTATATFTTPLIRGATWPATCVNANINYGLSPSSAQFDLALQAPAIATPPGYLGCSTNLAADDTDTAEAPYGGLPAPYGGVAIKSGARSLFGESRCTLAAWDFVAALTMAGQKSFPAPGTHIFNMRNYSDAKLGRVRCVTSPKADGAGLDLFSTCTHIGRPAFAVRFVQFE